MKSAGHSQSCPPQKKLLLKTYRVLARMHLVIIIFILEVSYHLCIHFFFFLFAPLQNDITIMASLQYKASHEH